MIKQQNSRGIESTVAAEMENWAQINHTVSSSKNQYADGGQRSVTAIGDDINRDMMTDWLTDEHEPNGAFPENQIVLSEPGSNDQEFGAYLNATRAGCADLCQISRDVINGIIYTSSKPETKFAWLANVQCEILVHSSSRSSLTVITDIQNPHIDPKLVLFNERMVNEGIYRFHFSVATTSLNPANRALVLYEGSDTGIGEWTCSKDSKVQVQRSGYCEHIKTACTDLYRRLGIDSMGELYPSLNDADSESPVRKFSEELAVSHLPVHVPMWASISSDKIDYDRPGPVRFLELGTEFKLQASSSCPCSSGNRTFFRHSQPTVFDQATVFTLFDTFPCTLELQPCPTCPSQRHQFIGPDLREYGIFNLNNSTLVSHDLLDDYTNAYTLSETPFDSWVESVNRRYEILGKRFMGKDLFRSCWFAYVRLQKFDGDFACPECGDYPENVIWDGVTLSFGRRHLLNCLSPPTIIVDNPPLRPNIKYFPKQQVFPDRDVRKLIRRTISMEPLDNWLKWSAEPATQDSAAASRKQGVKRPQKPEDIAGRLRDHFDTIDGLMKILGDINQGLVVLFTKHYGADAYKLGNEVPGVIHRFFHQISAEESIVQLINREGNKALKAFSLSPSLATASSLIGIPHVYELLNYDCCSRPSHAPNKAYSPEIVAICTWLYSRADEVLNHLLQQAAPLSPYTPSSLARPNDWEQVRFVAYYEYTICSLLLSLVQTGCYYSMPQIRDRPSYPRLIHDQQRDDGQDRGGKCSKTSSETLCGKYYATYGQKRLTGGLMVVWCSHSISYGFHCIPKSEGRNDVFSALVTRWPKAPKRIIYDFACALGPYCVLREPDFFADSHFMIDNFHARDHTKCAPACFSSTYATIDPAVSDINTSAAECGNSTILQIRKAVSYMGQLRSIIYTKVFLSILNRMKIRGMEKK
ncbi:hypothetical protein NP233_g9533 [Leucocoprinus birnbaumii]|uniref:HMG domain-containing protein n=1 Tax=Leucocoprinus birnbaumii TaxID=56174 RepID=A0AAD5YQS0_9AGAR|nr:hypothetical protein NP233_g9533 [Leucocoprinus birnbaumii]